MAVPSALEITKSIRRSETKVSDVVAAALVRVEAAQNLYNAFTLIRTKEAQEEARFLDKLEQNARGPLHGVPIAIKDLTPSRGDLTTKGSRTLAGHVAERDAIVVDRLRRAGAVVVAKTTTPEFAHSGFTRSPLWGETRNPWSADRTPGGSSGGSAVSVAAGCVPLAEGTDMGGSVRIPAALCGVLGMKPSLGRIPMDILSTGFDNISHFGAFSRSIGDLHAFLRVTEGASLMDIQSTSIHQPICANINSDLRGARIAVSEDLGFYSVDKCIIRNLQNSVNALIDAGAIVEKVSLNWKPSDVTLWAKLWAVLLSVETADVMDVFHDRLDPELMKFMSSVRDLKAVDYKMLDRRRTELWQDLASLFSVYDALLCPTMCITAPAIGMSDADFTMIDETGRLHAMDMTCLFNLVGQCPVVAVPSGLDLGGLPTSVQIVGRPYQDTAVLNIGAALEARNPWPLIPSMSM